MLEKVLPAAAVNPAAQFTPAPGRVAPAWSTYSTSEPTHPVTESATAPGSSSAASFAAAGAAAAPPAAAAASSASAAGSTAAAAAGSHHAAAASSAAPESSHASSAGGSTGRDSSAEGHSARGVKEALLKAALHHVPRLGWSQSALLAGASDVGLSPAAAGLLGDSDAAFVHAFSAHCNRELERRLAAVQQQLAALPVRGRIKAGVEARLEMIAPFIDSWPRALSLLAQPSALPTTLQQYAEIVDIIWHAAGDTSTDYSWCGRCPALLCACASGPPGHGGGAPQVRRCLLPVRWLTVAGRACVLGAHRGLSPLPLDLPWPWLQVLQAWAAGGGVHQH